MLLADLDKFSDHSIFVPSWKSQEPCVEAEHGRLEETDDPC